MMHQPVFVGNGDQQVRESDRRQTQTAPLILVCWQEGVVHGGGGGGGGPVSVVITVSSNLNNYAFDIAAINEISGSHSLGRRCCINPHLPICAKAYYAGTTLDLSIL